MRCVFVVCALVMGCESMEPSGDVLAAVDVVSDEAPQLVAVPVEPSEEPLVPGEAAEEDVAPEDEPEAPQEEVLSLDVVDPPGDADADVQRVAIADEGTPSANGVQPRWGLRVLSTLSETTPPRAMVVLPDGSEEVVRPGSMLPHAGVVVLSIAKDVVEISEIESQGMYASIRTRSIQALVAE